MLDPGRVGERLAAQRHRQRVEQLAKRLRARAGRAPAPAARPSLRMPRAIAQAGQPLDDEVDRVADGLDLGRLLLADADPVGVLELHHQLVEVERVGVEVLAEAGLVADLGRRRPRARSRGARAPSPSPRRASAPSITPPSYHASRRAGRAASARAARRCARPRRSSTARAASRTALAIPSGPELPWPTTATPRRPSRIAPPVVSGSICAAQAAERRAQQQPAGRRDRVPSAPRRGPRRRPPRRALDRLQRDVAGEAVGDDHVGRVGRAGRGPRRCRRSRSRSAPASAACASTTSGVPFFGSSPTESSATRGRSTPSTAWLKAAPR